MSERVEGDPMTTRKPFLLRLDPELHERIRVIAFEKKLPMQEVISRILKGVIMREREKNDD